MKTFSYRKIIRGSETWFNDACKAWMWDGPRKDLADILQNPVPTDFGTALTSIGQLAAWHARRGCVLLSEQRKDEGWGEVRRFLDYQLWSLRLDVERVRLTGGSQRNTADPTRKPFHLLGMVMAFRDWQSTDWLGEIATQSRENTLLGHGWRGGRREPLACYLFNLYRLSSSKDSFHDDFGPYLGLFENWSDPPGLEAPIRAACDYHVQQIRADGEFENNPHDIFASEILALYSVRKKLGLEAPRATHPLLDTPFTQVPERITYEPDPLVVQAMDLATKLLPQAVAKR